MNETSLKACQASHSQLMRDKMKLDERLENRPVTQVHTGDRVLRYLEMF